MMPLSRAHRRPRSLQVTKHLPELVTGGRGDCAQSSQLQGHDAGAETIAYHLAEKATGTFPPVSTIWRILRREGLVVPQRQKRPRSALIRFEAELPNEMWQADVTAWQLASGEVVEILNVIDDHSRLFLGADAYLRVKAADVVDELPQGSAAARPAGIFSRPTTGPC